MLNLIKIKIKIFLFMQIYTCVHLYIYICIRTCVQRVKLHVLLFVTRYPYAIIYTGKRSSHLAPVRS